MLPFFFHFYYFLILFFIFLFYQKFLIFAQDSVCSIEELIFGPCLPGNPKTCPLTCPTGCHCVENICCYPKSSVQNNFWDRINQQQPPLQQQQEQQNSMGNSLQNGGQLLQQQNNGQSINNYLLMLLLLKQQQQQGGGGGNYFNDGGFFGCQDQASNCASFSPLCFYSTKMLLYCPSSCGICSLYNPQFVSQRLLQILLGNGGGGIGGNFGGNIGGNFLPFGGGNFPSSGGIQQPSTQQQQQLSSNTLGRIQGFLDQAQGVANSANTALGTIGGPGLNLQTIGQALGQRLGGVG